MKISIVSSPPVIFILVFFLVGSIYIIMELVHAIMLVLLLVLIVLVSKDSIMGLCSRGQSRVERKNMIQKIIAGDDTAAAASPTASSDTTQALKQAGSANLNVAASAAMAENAEYFTVCKGADEISKALDCSCDDATGYPFAQNEFGGPGMDYNTYVMSQGVDSQVIKNHANFVEDRRNVNARGGEFTGKTWSPQTTVEGVGNSSNWIGIRGRPMAVPVCNPTTVQHDEPDEYRTKRYCF